METAVIPEKFGEYTTLRDDKGQAVVLGSGGFGTTVCAYRTRELGQDMTLRDDYAVKILRVEAIEDPKRRRAFVNEIVALRDLQHPNLVRYIDCGEQGGSIFMVMDLCRGGDLERIVRKLGPFRERAALQVILQLCAGLDEAHRSHYLHRDLKPRNVLLTEALPPDATMNWLEESLTQYRLRFKIVDFGLAGKLGGEIRNSGFVGSPMFASPEQVREKRDLDFRSDIYSLGMTLWYLVTGNGPLLRADGKPINDAREAMKAHTSPTPHDLAFPTTLHPEFRQLMSRMVRKAREERFGRVDELIPAIRAVLDRLPASLPIAVAAPPPPVPEVALPQQPMWGQGALEDYFAVQAELGARPVGRQMRATLKEELGNPFVILPKGTELALTSWSSTRSPDSETELRVASHLSRLWSLTWAHTAPAGLARVLDVRRTATEWGVSEEWNGGASLEEVLAARPQPLKVAEAAALLVPVAEVVDFLREKNVERALLSSREIRIFREGASTEGEAWPSEPMDSWNSWGVHVSAFTVPSDLVEAQGDLGGTKFPLMRAFCRLFYRLMQGVEVPEAADSDPAAYETATHLRDATSELLRDCLCGAREMQSAMELLSSVCESEGLAELPLRVEKGNTRGPFGASSFASGSIWARDLHRPEVEVDPNDPSISSVMNTVTIQPLPGPAGGQGATGDAVGGLVPSAHVSSYASGSSFGSPWAGPATGASVSATSSASGSAALSQGGITFDEAELMPGSPGLVRSPYGGRNQQWISGPDWRPGNRVLCETTFRLFQLPQVLPPLPANLLDGRFDAVLSPYVDPPQVIGVPLGRWRPGEEFICSYTKLPVVMPMELPRAEATVVEGESGTVRSPYGTHVEFAVAPAFWRPEQILTCPESNQELVLPKSLPPLHAMPTESAGCFTSPYAPTQRFTLYPRECTPGFAFECPNTGNRLVVPPSLPAAWRFEGRVRAENGPEAKSPFLEMGEDLWQPVDMAGWHPRGVVLCARTQREFGLPARLPALPVRPAEEAPAICSPFPPHEAIPVPGKSWFPGAELTVKLANGAECKVVLEAESLAPLAAIPTETAGVFTSPYAPESRFAVPPPNCVGGYGVICPSTQRKLVVPTELPRNWWFEGLVRQEDVPEARSPFVAEEDRAWQPVALEDWGPGARATCHITKREFHLPSPLPALKVKVGPRAETILSPFPPHETLTVPEAYWIPWQEVSVRLSNGDKCLVTLPADLTPGVEATEPASPRAEAPVAPTSVPVVAPAPRPAAAMEAVVVSPGQVRSFSTGAAFSVSGEQWISGAPILSPSGESLRLPAYLPAMSASLGPMPGIVRSPYVAQPTDQRVPPTLWHGGMEIPCATTGRKMRLPDILPPLGPSVAPSTGPSLLVPAILVGICFLGLIALAVFYFMHK